MQKLDLLILGGGPSGAAAAITAARAGLRVMLLERAVFPRHRPGETLHPGIEPLLRQLEALHAVEASGCLRHPGNWIEWGGPEVFAPFGADNREPWLGYQALRADFDARLLETAAAAGAQVQLGASAGEVLVRAGKVAGIRTGQEEVWAEFVVDAAGDRHLLARRLGVRIIRYSRPLVVRYGYVTGDCPSRDEAPRIAADEHGWTWTSRVAPRLYQWTRLDLRPGHPRLDWRPSEFVGLVDSGPVRGADVTWRLAERVAGPGYFLIGDAAAVLDPVSSHGVLRAIMSGVMAAHLAALTVANGNRELETTQAYRDWLSNWFFQEAQKLGGLYERSGLSVAETGSPWRRADEIEGAG